MSKEYIEREALFEKLHEVGGCDADTGTWAAGYDAAIDLVIAILEKEPAADVVEVVRCKDCKHARKMNVRESEVFVDGCVMCDKIDINGSEYPMLPDDFCSYGERKEINNDT